MIEKFDEMTYSMTLQTNDVTMFLKHLEQYDEKVSSELLLRGFVKKNRSSRTVTFSFGDVTFERNRWYKNGKCYVPIDDYLSLERYSRYSREFLCKIAQLASYMPYRKVVETIKVMLNIDITKDVVLKAVKLVNHLVEEREDYRFFEEEPEDKKEVEVLHIEGDGVFVKSTDTDDNRQHNEIAHFIVHEGSNKVASNRCVLQHKKAFISTNNREARQQVIDYIYNQYHITEKTRLITVSDGGHGYSPEIFSELSKELNIKQHEHFFDSYHVVKIIKRAYRYITSEIESLIFEALHQNDKQLLTCALDTAEAFITGNDDYDETYFEEFKQFGKRIKRYFKYMISPWNRGMSSGGIGIIESQHRKITYRMKGRGMYWGKIGIKGMSNLIIKVYEGTLRDLFFGDWREKYAYYKKLEKYDGYDVCKSSDSNAIVKNSRIFNNVVKELSQKGNVFS